MLTANGQVKVTDFGIAKMLDDDIGLTNTGMVVGTVQYMSPEQIAAKPASARSDQFSLGVIAYEMLTGQKPFQGNSWASVMNQIINVEPPPVKQHRQDLGDEVTTVLRKALAKDPEARYSSCREFADELAHAVTGVTMQRTAPMPIGEALTRPLPPPRTDVLPETQAMASMTAIPAKSDSSPDTGQKMTPTSKMMPASSAAPAKAATERATAKRRSALTPILMGAAAVLVLGAVWWRFSAHPVSTPPSSAPVAATTAAPATPAQAGASQPADQTTAPAPASPRNEVAPRPPVSKSTTAAPQPAQSQPVSVAGILTSSAPPATVAAATPAPPAATPASPVATPAPTVATPAAQVAAPAPQVTTSAPPPAPAPKPAPVQSSPAPAPAVAASATPAPPVTRNPDADASAGRAEEQRKASELSAARTAVDEALNRYRTAFENKDSEALKGVWPGLGRSELTAFQNFFKIARSIKLQLRPLGEAEISAAGATIRARRTMAATDERGALPTQDQTVNIHLRRAGNGMVIESIDIAGK
jgi:serine/threonine-protein kinase